jgi:hypothetical protein
MTVTTAGEVAKKKPMTRRATPYRDRLRFERLPAAYCHPERIDALLPEGLPSSLRERLHGSTRLNLRLSALLTRRLELSPLTLKDLSTPEGRFAQLEGQALKDALQTVGAIWQARTIRKIILKAPLRELVERLGRDTHRAALRFVNLAPEPASDRQAISSETPDIDKLMRWIERDGLLAANAWCRHQPAALAERLRLKLPPGSEIDGEPPTRYIDRGPKIVDRVIMMLPAAIGKSTDDMVLTNG